MNRTINAPATLAAIALFFACSAAARATSSVSDLAALGRVVEVFRTCIINKDKSTFVELFFSAKPELITWQSVVDDPSLARIQRTKPEARKARFRPENNFVAFIDEIVATRSAEEERFSNVQIDTDGEIASVSFDYVYFHDARPTNHGREKWQLVKTEKGWKIISVVYSVRLPGAQGGD